MVVVEGAAGTGKTTTLAAASDCLDSEGHRLVVVAPTLKAARVAGEQVGCDAFSAAWLVHQHGFRWDDDGRWHRVDPDDHPSPNALARLLPGDLLLVDEAGMLDQDVMRALLTVADDSGARVALVGDRHQLVIHPTEVERLAAVTQAAAGDLRAAPLLIADTREQVGLLNAAIRDLRLADGGAFESSEAATLTTSAGEQLSEGDRVATRRNDRDLGVANRDTWTVAAVADDRGLVAPGAAGAALEIAADPGWIPPDVDTPKPGASPQRRTRRRQAHERAGTRFREHVLPRDR
ncbi:AAA family ATPase [Nocardioides sp. cx-169]|uniref:AAA family ATPase n=1 Tax=Nocardioides sp. cx-169 TaxID=2899080 RepID=UPI001E2DA563|nr:AAA family ATPase [Nocardioides sp. cx-169]MCD4535071.1 AAA family ATPase [Nocardioides sp. cx-169]